MNVIDNATFTGGSPVTSSLLMTAKLCWGGGKVAIGGQTGEIYGAYVPHTVTSTGTMSSLTLVAMRARDQSIHSNLLCFQGSRSKCWETPSRFTSRIGDRVALTTTGSGFITIVPSVPARAAHGNQVGLKKFHSK